MLFKRFVFNIFLYFYKIIIVQLPYSVGTEHCKMCGSKSDIDLEANGLTAAGSRNFSM